MKLRRWFVLAAVALVASRMVAQGPPGGPAGQRPTPLPDHWMTLDSLAQAVGIGAAAKARVAEPYNALNAVMRDAAARRRQIRDRMQQELGGRSMADLSEEERGRIRTRFDSARAELEEFQAEADQWHLTIRNLLTSEQQVRFDALPKPIVFRMRPGPRTP